MDTIPPSCSAHIYILRNDDESLSVESSTFGYLDFRRNATTADIQWCYPCSHADLLMRRLRLEMPEREFSIRDMQLRVMSKVHDTSVEHQNHIDALELKAKGVALQQHLFPNEMVCLVQSFLVCACAVPLCLHKLDIPVSFTGFIAHSGLPLRAFLCMYDALLPPNSFDQLVLFLNEEDEKYDVTLKLKRWQRKERETKQLPAWKIISMESEFDLLAEFKQDGNTVVKRRLLVMLGDAPDYKDDRDLSSCMTQMLKAHQTFPETTSCLFICSNFLDDDVMNTLNFVLVTEGQLPASVLHMNLPPERMDEICRNSLSAWTTYALMRRASGKLLCSTLPAFIKRNVVFPF